MIGKSTLDAGGRKKEADGKIPLLPKGRRGESDEEGRF